MKADRQIKVLLLAIVILLAVIVARPYVTPITAHADSTAGFPVFIEPGVHMLRAPDNSQRVLGKVVVDLRNGNIWGFPTLQPDPYPHPGTTRRPPTTRGFLLGRFELSDINR
jgi:hypothetical protein